MKSFIVAIVVAVFCMVAAVQSSAYGPSPLSLGKGGLGYGAAPAGPPCPKSVVVGCAPLVQSVPCKGGAGGGIGGAYSEQYPQYVQQQSAPVADYATSASSFVPQYYVPRYVYN